MSKPSLVLNAYGNVPLSPVGLIKVDVQYENVKQKLDLYITSSFKAESTAFFFKRKI